MPKVFTKPEPIKLLENPYITYVGNHVLLDIIGER